MDRWYGPDELRTSWCFVVLDLVESQEVVLRRWEVGDGNADQLLETKSKTIDEVAEEAELLVELGAELNERRYDQRTLITPSHRTLKLLRGRFLSVDKITQPTLRGFRHVALADLVDHYFDDDAVAALPGLKQEITDEKQTTEQVQSINSVDQLWRLRSAIGPLVPVTDLLGTQL